MNTVAPVPSGAAPQASTAKNSTATGTAALQAILMSFARSIIAATLPGGHEGRDRAGPGLFGSQG